MATRVRLPLHTIPLLLGALLLASPAPARAANNCPWMNESTASALIGRDASGTYVAASSRPALCIFNESGDRPLRRLQISVETARDAHGRYLAVLRQSCPSHRVPLPAIGNEAMFCTLDQRHGGIEEMAVARVRDQIFTVTLATTVKNDAILSPAMLQMKIGSAAELVAGNLF